VGDPAETPTSAGLLARRLRDLRLRGCPEVRLTQKQLASALSQGEPVADSTLSSWENVQSPAPPPHSRLSAYAQFFSTERSVDGDPHLVSVEELTADEDNDGSGSSSSCSGYETTSRSQHRLGR
jgi:transcriptional regulator with XRE-family HTH domain